jgi:aminoglycoside phosphotransferase (APT) family kinase protein
MSMLTQPIAAGRTAEVFAWKTGQVIKLFHDWVPEEWVTHELHISRLVEAAGLPAPAVLGDIFEVDGRRAICYQRVDGPSLNQVITSHPFRLAAHASLLGELHAGMHTRPGAGLPSQRKKLVYKLHEAEPLPANLKEAALQALDRLPDGELVCHGDFHPGNILMTAQGPVVIDWTDACSGNPLADVARSVVLLMAADVPLTSRLGWILKFGRDRMLEAYLHSYFQFSRLDQNQLQAWIPIVAAARLNEQIPRENECLLALARRGLT